MKVTVIGATGHIGTFLVPRLVAAGHEVTAVSRGGRAPYRRPTLWDRVRLVQIDRREAEKKHGFGKKVAELGGEVVIDLILFHPDSLPQLMEALAGKVRQFIYCGTMWVYGPTEKAPTLESDPRRPDPGTYGQQKAQIESELLEAALKGHFPATVLHPGHIVGPGWVPINPAGNLELEVFEKLGRGEALALPDQGLATLHHVHADDVAQTFELALANPAALGQSFNVVSPAALTLRGFCRAVAGWFGQEARLEYLPWPEWRGTVSEQAADDTWEHIRHCPCGSIEKARRLLGYSPRYSSLEAVRESLAWLIRHGQVDLPALD